MVVATLLRARGSTGVQTHFGELVGFRASRGLPVALVTPFSDGGAGRDALFAVRRLLSLVHGGAGVLWYNRFHRLFLERALRGRLAAMGPAAVYCQCPGAALAALRSRRDPSQRVVLAVHFCGSQADEWVLKGAITRDGRAFRAIRRIEADVLARVDGLVFVSDAAREQLWQRVREGLPSATIPNFVAAAPASPPGRATGSHAELVTVGALEPNKNHAFLVDVLAVAARRGHRFTLDVIGDGPERRALFRRCQAAGVGDQVRFLGYVPDTRRLLAGYRAYVHVAQRESFGLAVLEAMAAGLPVVAAPVGGLAQVFDDGVEGRALRLDDPAAAAQVLIEVMCDEPTRSRMAAAARQRFRRQFATDVVCPVLEDFLTGTSAPGVPGEAHPAPAEQAPWSERVLSTEQVLS
ncbi:MAG: glycosyltransferase family 4 protein [Acidimicrobiales bacterium]